MKHSWLALIANRQLNSPLSTLFRKGEQNEKKSVILNIPQDHRICHTIVPPIQMHSVCREKLLMWHVAVHYAAHTGQSLSAQVCQVRWRIGLDEVIVRLIHTATTLLKLPLKLRSTSSKNSWCAAVHCVRPYTWNFKTLAQLIPPKTFFPHFWSLPLSPTTCSSATALGRAGTG